MNYPLDLIAKHCNIEVVRVALGNNFTMEELKMAKKKAAKKKTAKKKTAKKKSKK